MESWRHCDRPLSWQRGWNKERICDFKFMRILVLDNYDSFTYNLVHILRELDAPPEVHRNDKITLEDVGKYDKILLSPGPGIPDEAGIMKSVIKRYSSTKSILGIC